MSSSRLSSSVAVPRCGLRNPRCLRQSALIKPRRTKRPGGRAGNAGLSSGVDRRSLAYADANGNRPRNGEAESDTYAYLKCNDGAVERQAGAAFANGDGAKPSRKCSAGNGTRGDRDGHLVAVARPRAHGHGSDLAQPNRDRRAYVISHAFPNAYPGSFSGAPGNGHGRPDSYADGDSCAHVFANPDPGADRHRHANPDPGAHGHSDAGAYPLAHRRAATATG